MRHDEYAEAAVQRHLIEDGVAEQGIDVVRRDEIIVVRGEVESPQRRDEVLSHVSSHFPGRKVHSEVLVVSVSPPAEAEELL